MNSEPPAASGGYKISVMLQRPLARHLLKVLSGNIAGNALHLLAIILIGRALPEDAAGLFLSLQAALLLIAQIADFGLNTTMVKYYRELVLQDREPEAEALLRQTLYLRLGIITLILIPLLFLARPITHYFFNTPDAAPLFRLICLGAVGSALWSFGQACMQARQQFGWYALFTTGNHALRLALIWWFYIEERLTLGKATTIMSLIPFFGVASVMMITPAAFYRAKLAAGQSRQQLISIFHFSKWVFLSSITVSVIMRMDILLTTWLAGAAAAAQFGMAERFAMAIPLVTHSLSAVLLPKLAATRERKEMLKMKKIFNKALPLLLLAAIPCMAAGHLLLPWLLGARYQPSAFVFDILVLGFLLEIVINPMSYFCLAFEKAKWLTWMNSAQLALSLLAGLALIPFMGASGAALSSLLVRLFALFFVMTAFQRLLAMADADEEPMFDK